MARQAGQTTAVKRSSKKRRPGDVVDDASLYVEAPSAPAHTLQLIIMLLLQCLLLIAAVLYVPQGVFSKTGPPLTLYSGLYEMLNPPDRNADAVRAKFAAALKSVFIVQSLCISRLKWWWDVGAKIEKGDSIKELKKQSGLLKQTESLVLTTFALPLPIGLSYLLIICFGAPAMSDLKSTLILAAYTALMSLYAPLHILGEDWSGWVQLFSAFEPRNPREKVLLIQTTAPLIGIWLSSAALALDWNRAWQAWPIPGVLGCLAGAIIGNLLALTVYLFSKPAKVKRA